MWSGIVHHKSDRKSCVLPTADRNTATEEFLAKADFSMTRLKYKSVLLRFNGIHWYCGLLESSYNPAIDHCNPFFKLELMQSDVILKPPVYAPLDILNFYLQPSGCQPTAGFIWSTSPLPKQHGLHNYKRQMLGYFLFFLDFAWHPP